MITFRVSDAAGGNPCSPGFGQAVALFDPAQDYSVAQMLEAGLSPEYVDWIVMHKASQDDDALAGLRRWAGLLGADLADDATYQDASRALQRAWAAEVKALCLTGMAKAKAGRVAGAHYRETMIAAFAG